MARRLLCATLVAWLFIGGPRTIVRGDDGTDAPVPADAPAADPPSAPDASVPAAGDTSTPSDGGVCTADASTGSFNTVALGDVLAPQSDSPAVLQQDDTAPPAPSSPDWTTPATPDWAAPAPSADASAPSPDWAAAAPVPYLDSSLFSPSLTPTSTDPTASTAPSWMASVDPSLGIPASTDPNASSSSLTPWWGAQGSSLLTFPTSTPTDASWPDPAATTDASTLAASLPTVDPSAAGSSASGLPWWADPSLVSTPANPTNPWNDPVQAAIAAQPQTYTVQPTDTLDTISQKTNVSPDELVKANPVLDGLPYGATPTQPIALPNSGSSNSGSSNSGGSNSGGSNSGGSNSGSSNSGSSNSGSSNSGGSNSGGSNSGSSNSGGSNSGGSNSGGSNSGGSSSGDGSNSGASSAPVDPNMSSDQRIQAMIDMANQITAQHYPYSWGGGHSNFDGPYDCSGSVSAVLHAGGFLDAPLTSAQFGSWGDAGAGDVTLYVNPGVHVYMSINGQFFGTSGSNPGGGAGWFNGGPRAGFQERHVPLN